MRVTISQMTAPDAPLLTLVDGPGWLNSWPIHGEVFGLDDEGLDDAWYGSADSRIEAMPDRPGVDGAFWPEESLLAARTFPIRGFHSVRGLPGVAGTESSTLSVARARDLLASLTGLSVRVTVEDESGVREVTGYVSSRPLVRRVDAWRTMFSIIVTCPDPLKYGAPVQYPAGSGVLEIENTGTGAVPFAVTYRNAPPSPPQLITSLDVAFEGRHVKWVGSSLSLTLDLDDGRPVNDSGVEVGYLVDADAIRIPPGRHEVTVTADVPVTVTLRPGWK